MNLRQIEVFRAVMLTGSITDAARLLQVSQPGVSRLVRHLESTLGTALFERLRGRLQATPEAQLLFAEIERVHRGLRQVQEVAAGLRHGVPATLRVAATANTALQLAPRAIARLVAAIPGVRVAFEMLPVREIERRLIAEEVDLAVSSAPIEHPAVHSRPIGKWSLVCALPASHPLAARRRVPLALAVREPLIVYSPEAPQSAVIEGWLTRHRVRARPALTVRSGYSACALAAAGAGLAFVDDLSARAHRSEGVAFRDIVRAPSFPVFVAYPGLRPPSRAGRELLDGFEHELQALQREPVHAGA